MYIAMYTVCPCSIKDSALGYEPRFCRGSNPLMGTAPKVMHDSRRHGGLEVACRDMKRKENFHEGADAFTTPR